MAVQGAVRERVIDCIAKTGFFILFGLTGLVETEFLSATERSAYFVYRLSFKSTRTPGNPIVCRFKAGAKPGAQTEKSDC